MQELTVFLSWNTSQRLAEFYRRLGEAPRPRTAEEAIRLIGDTLNAVEDEFSGAPFDPENWRTDGRMYPVMADRVSVVSEAPRVLKLASLGHFTLVADNGAFKIVSRTTREVVFQKPGSNGKEVDDV